MAMDKIIQKPATFFFPLIGFSNKKKKVLVIKIA